MEGFCAARNTARKRYQVAEHMLTQTYPLVRDPKLLLGVLQNGLGSMEASLSAWLEYEIEQKRLQSYPESLQGKIHALQERIPKEHVVLITQMKEMLKEHEESPVEITKDEKMIIFDKEYHATKLTPNLLKEQLRGVRAFLFLMETKVAKNDAVIARRS